MQEPILFYKQQLTEHRAKAKHLRKQMGWLSTSRLAVFLLTGFGIYQSFDQWQIAVGIAMVGSVVFLILLARYTDFKTARALHQRLVAINETELKIAANDFHDQPEGNAFQDPRHAYSLDIDLFGRGSFFQYANRTTIKEGTDNFVKYLLANNITGIAERQEAIQELTELSKWRQQYTALSQGVHTEHSARSIISWVRAYKPFLKKWHFLGSILFSLLSLGIIGLGIIEVIPIGLSVYWLLLGLAVTGFYLKRINVLAQHTGRAKDTFRQYALLLEQIEEQRFTSTLLKQQQIKIESNGIKASQVFKRFSKALDALDNRNNLISAIFGNGYLLSDIRQAYHVEQWIKAYGDKVEDWFEVVIFFDTFNSFGTFAFNHQDFAYPSIIESDKTLVAKALGHPLLPRHERITSDMELLESQFFIVTGANMAGKSTFLRTVALHIVMANVGLPVCAASSSYTPIKLITSMRTTDSLADHSSYFFSELTRLKCIVETITEETAPYFVILDEILKGTNSTDKAIGSRKFVEKLVTLKATGIIATHDLSLTEIEKELKAVKNYFFDAQIINDELYFDYKLKEGVCQNMNASFLLKKMEII